MTAPKKRSRAAAYLAIIGGLVQIAAALAILFLPVLGNCSVQEGGELICSRLSYIQMGGNAFGYGILIAMIGVGALAVSSAQESNLQRILLVRWGATLFSGVIAIITGFSFGIVFMPGAVLLLISAIWTTVRR
jgi:hypothetical protein